MNKRRVVEPKNYKITNDGHSTIVSSKKFGEKIQAESRRD